MVDRDLDGVGGGEAGGDEHRPAPHDVVEEVDQEFDVELAVERRRAALGAAPAGQVGGEDLEALGQPLRGAAPLERVVAGTEGMQQDDRARPRPRRWKTTSREIPGVAVAAAPDGRFEPSGRARDRGVDERGDADRRTAEEQAAEDPLRRRRRCSSSEVQAVMGPSTLPRGVRPARPQPRPRGARRRPRRAAIPLPVGGLHDSSSCAPSGPRHRRSRARRHDGDRAGARSARVAGRACGSRRGFRGRAPARHAAGGRRPGQQLRPGGVGRKRVGVGPALGRLLRSGRRPALAPATGGGDRRTGRGRCREAVARRHDRLGGWRLGRARRRFLWSGRRAPLERGARACGGLLLGPGLRRRPRTGRRDLGDRGRGEPGGPVAALHGGEPLRRRQRRRRGESSPLWRIGCGTIRCGSSERLAVRSTCWRARAGARARARA